jgi:hypothetical protein
LVVFFVFFCYSLIFGSTNTFHPSTRPRPLCDTYIFLLLTTHTV